MWGRARQQRHGEILGRIKTQNAILGDLLRAVQDLTGVQATNPSAVGPVGPQIADSKVRAALDTTLADRTRAEPDARVIISDEDACELVELSPDHRWVIVHMADGTQKTIDRWAPDVSRETSRGDEAKRQFEGTLWDGTKDGTWADQVYDASLLCTCGLSGDPSPFHHATCPLRIDHAEKVSTEEAVLDVEEATDHRATWVKDKATRTAEVINHHGKLIVTIADHHVTVYRADGTKWAVFDREHDTIHWPTDSAYSAGVVNLKDLYDEQALGEDRGVFVESTDPPLAHDAEAEQGEYAAHCRKTAQERADEFKADFEQIDEVAQQVEQITEVLTTKVLNSPSNGPTQDVKDAVATAVADTYLILKGNLTVEDFKPKDTQ